MSTAKSSAKCWCELPRAQPRRCRRLSGRSSLLPKQGGGALLDLLWRKVFLVRGDGPLVAERIEDRAGTVAIELVLHRSKHLRAGRNRAGGHGVRILEVEHQRDRRAADRLRPARVHFGELVGEHDARIT